RDVRVRICHVRGHTGECAEFEVPDAGGAALSMSVPSIAKFEVPNVGGADPSISVSSIADSKCGRRPQA
ncbi:MAG TPA: hypothetical protein VHC69_31985, partial [Polyangiaceae bacterium]|nr:hypothetical protein [Polyangiaceae bacterium]